MGREMALDIFRPIRYQGKGLDHGECGIRIAKAEDEHEGDWKCATNIKSKPLEMEITKTIAVKVDRPISKLI